MIPRDTIDRIFSAAKIEEVVADYVSLKKRGANLIGLCPFHDEKTGSFTVSPSKSIYKCFGCGKSGNAVGFVMEIEQCSYADALRMLGKRYGIPIEERELTKDEQQRQDDRESMFVVNEFSNQWFQQQLWETDEGKAVGLSYLRQRGLRDDIIHKFQIGYSPDKSALCIAAKEKGFTEKYLVNDSQNAPYIGTGVCLKSEDGRLYDRFHSRVIFPFFSQSGKVIGFAGRLLKQNDKVGKYVNSPTSPLFEKHDCLYGLYQAKQTISRLDRCYLVEGQMDVISMFQAGIENVVASGGTSLTKPQIKLIHRFTNHITVLYDGDKAGIKAALRGIDMILEEDINVKVLLLPEGEDPDSFAKTHTAEEFATYINENQTDFLRFKIHLYKDEISKEPAQRGGLIQDIIRSIVCIPNQIKRSQYVRLVSNEFNVEEDVVYREITRQIRANKQKQYENVQNTEQKSNENQPSEDLMYSTDELKAQRRNKIFLENIENLLQLIIRYGERTLYTNDSGAPILVGEYIINEFQNDEIAMRSTIHQRILDEYGAHYKEPNFQAQSFFVRHLNPEISQFAIRHVEDKYQINNGSQGTSKKSTQEDADRLPSLVNELLLELKYTIINERLDVLQRQLKVAIENNDSESIRSILSCQIQMENIRSTISKALGDRVITA